MTALEIVKLIVVPTLSALIGGAMSLGVGYVLARRSELYRRLSRREGLGDKLWDKRVDICISLLEYYDEYMRMVTESMMAAWNKAEKQPERSTELATRMTKHSLKRGKVNAGMNAISSQRLIDASHQLDMAFMHAFADAQSGSGSGYNRAAIQLQHFFNAVRNELFTGELDQNLLDGIVPKSVKDDSKRST